MNVGPWTWDDGVARRFYAGGIIQVAAVLAQSTTGGWSWHTFQPITGVIDHQAVVRDLETAKADANARLTALGGHLDDGPDQPRVRFHINCVLRTEPDAPQSVDDLRARFRAKVKLDVQEPETTGTGPSSLWPERYGTKRFLQDYQGTFPVEWVELASKPGPVSDFADATRYAVEAINKAYGKIR